MRGKLVFTGLLLFAANAQAAPVKIERGNALLKFTYEWPQEAAADLRLDAFLRAKATAEWRERLAGEEDNRKDAEKENFRFRQGYETISWELGGQTRRLLSLKETGESMSSGMAHPAHWNNALLWDRRRQKQVDFEQLFLNRGTFARLTRERYCRALNDERHRRLAKFLGAERSSGPFDACPQYSDLSIVPVDSNKNGRFDTIAFIAAQGSAGTNPEGEYAIPLPVTRQMIAAIKPVYRSSFEPQRQ